MNKASLRQRNWDGNVPLPLTLDHVLPPKAFIRFQNELLCIAEERMEYESESVSYKASGEEFNVHIYWSVVPGYEKTLEKVIIAIEDITARKQTQIQLQDQLDELRRWYAVTLGREKRILELKDEVNQLLSESGKPPHYASARTVESAHE